MRVGSLVRSRHDPGLHGVVMEVGPQETRTDHGNRACRVQWLDEEVTFEFVKLLEVLSEPTG
jgi:hypothetical protein